MKKYFIFITPILLMGCAAANNLSQKTNGEKVSLVANIARTPANVNVNTNKDFIEKKFGIMFGGVPELIIPLISDLAVKQVKKIIDRNAEKYSASYSAILVADNFYTDKNSTTKLKIESFTLKRLIDNGTTAVEIKIKPEISDDTQFMRLRVESAKVDYTKAKLKNDDNTIDLELSIDLVSKYMNDATPTTLESKGMTLKLESLDLGQQYTTFENATTEWFQTLQRSTDGTNFTGTGNYILKIHVKEYDNYGERVKEIAKTYGEHEDDLVKILEAILSKKEK